MYRKNILLLFEALYKEKDPSQRQCRSKPCVEYCDEMEWEQLKSPDQYPTSDHHHHDHKGLQIQEAIDWLLLPFIAEHPGCVLFDQSAEDHKVEQKEYDHGEQIIDNGMIVLVSQNPDPKHIDPCNQPYGSSDNQQVFFMKHRVSFPARANVLFTHPVSRLFLFWIIRKAVLLYAMLNLQHLFRLQCTLPPHHLV